MNRRGFLQSLLGVAAGVALPKPALDLLARTEALPDAEFQREVFADEAIIDVMQAYIRAASLALMKALDEDIYREISAASNSTHPK